MRPVSALPQILLSIILASIILASIILASIAVAAEEVEFNRDIRPILSEKCFFCHGPDAGHRQADLRLDVDAIAKQHAITSGNADESELIARLISTDPETKMPPPESEKTISDEEIELIRRWIDQGATYQGHWAFRPPRKSSLPTIDREDWSQNPIDQFVLDQLVHENIQPSPRASRAELVRRLSLDLTGLPPTVEMVRQFVDDPNNDALQRVVDQLLDSQHYGEHMARYWLDAARYADTNGYQYDLEREQWVWRDWVISSFNDNLPFDQFTIDQIAGDMLPDATDAQRLATGFHRNHPITIEGGVIDEEYRTEYVVDRVVTTSTVWLGLTIGCCRCHDHKYDPISQREFYEFFAFFNNVAERGLNGFDPKRKISSPLAEKQMRSLDEQIALARSRLDRLTENGLPIDQWAAAAIKTEQQAWSVVVPDQMNAIGGTEFTVQGDKSVLAGGPNPATETYELILERDLASIGADPIGAVQLEAFPDPSTTSKGAGRGSNGNFVLSEIEVQVATASDPDKFRAVELARAEADYSQQNYDVSLAIDGKADNTGWAVDGNSRQEPRTARFYFQTPIRRESGLRFRIRLIHQYGGSHHIARFRLSLRESDQQTIPLTIAALLKTPESERTTEQQQQITEALIAEFGSAAAKSLSADLQAARRQRAQLIRSVPETLVMADRDEPRKTHILMRGEYDHPGEEVHAGTPAVLPPIGDDLPRNRLGLARWLVAPDHPLTARVTVNRLWQQFFGNGIVKTTEDFGAQGEWPSHPELLDWLAVDFVESGWNVKSLIKKIVTSETYQQSGNLAPGALERDPENRLLARGPRMRLDAEVIRDSALRVSGLLNPLVGGPSVFPYQPAGLWQEINNRPGYSRTYKQDVGGNLYRRSLYTFWKRTLPPPSMASFDAPERETCRVRRSRTNTPLQALVLLHDPQFVEAARHLAGTMIAAGGDRDDSRIDLGFRRCYSRSPSDGEREALKEILKSRRVKYNDSPELTQSLLAVGDSSVEASAELAAWTTVARTLMNLSEFVTKP